MEIVFGVPQGSILGPFWRNILFGDLFFIVTSMDIAKYYADENTPYATANDIDSLIASLEEVSKYLFTWFDNNLKTNNGEKCLLLVSSNEKVTIKKGSHEITDTKHEKLSGLQVCVLARITSGMSFLKNRTLMNVFLNSQFNYRPLIWMFHSRQKNNKINKLYEMC